eukprot:2427673-Pleurochrysis_carterae.AAC.1
MHRSQRLLKYGGQVSSRHRQGATGCMCHGGGGEACSAVEEGMKASMTNVVIKKIRRTGRRDGRAARHACFANIREAVLPFRLNSFQTRPAASERAVQTAAAPPQQRKGSVGRRKDTIRVIWLLQESLAGATVQQKDAERPRNSPSRKDPTSKGSKEKSKRRETRLARNMQITCLARGGDKNSHPMPQKKHSPQGSKPIGTDLGLCGKVVIGIQTNTTTKVRMAQGAEGVGRAGDGRSRSHARLAVSKSRSAAGQGPDRTGATTDPHPPAGRLAKSVRACARASVSMDPPCASACVSCRMISLPA